MKKGGSKRSFLLFVLDSAYGLLLSLIALPIHPMYFVIIISVVILTGIPRYLLFDPPMLDYNNEKQRNWVVVCRVLIILRWLFYILLTGFIIHMISFLSNLCIGGTC